MNLPTTLRWIALALLGLIIAASVALAASRLASQQIGIASESVSAGDSLAPPVTSTGKDRRAKPEEKAPAKKKPAPEVSAPAVESSEPSETVEPEPPAVETVEPSSGDDGGGGGGGGDGGGGGGADD